MKSRKELAVKWYSQYVCACSEFCACGLSLVGVRQKAGDQVSSTTTAAATTSHRNPLAKHWIKALYSTSAGEEGGERNNQKLLKAKIRGSHADDEASEDSRPVAFPKQRLETCGKQTVGKRVGRHPKLRKRAVKSKLSEVFGLHLTLHRKKCKNSLLFEDGGQNYLSGHFYDITLSFQYMQDQQYEPVAT